MAQRLDSELAAKMVTEIVVAYLARNPLEPSAVGGLIREVRHALDFDDGLDAPVEPRLSDREPAEAHSSAVDELGAGGSLRPALANITPAVPIDQSVHDDYIVSLEDGQRYRSLRRHLMARYGMTPDDYRRKWALPADYPMVAPSYARDRSNVAKRIGLGHSKPAPARSKRRRTLA